MALREILARFGFEIDDKKLKNADKGVDSFKSKVMGMAGLIGGAMIVQGIRSFITQMIATGSALNDTSVKLGISTSALQQWQLAAKLVGVEASGLNNALKFLQKNTAAAADGGKEQSKVFKELGVDIKDASGKIRPTTELLRDTGLAIANMQDPAKRTAALMKVFGKSGADLGPLFADGAAGLDKLLAKFEELGGGLSEDAIKALDEAGDLIDEFDFATLSLKSHLAVQLFPTLNALVGYIIKGVVAISKATEGTNIFKAAIITLGTVAVATAIKMLAPYLPIIAGFALLILIVDELITLFQGGDTLIGRFIDNLFGAGTAAAWVKEVKEDFGGLWNRMGEAEGVGAKIEEVFSTLGETLIKFFVEDIPEAWDFLWADINSSIVGEGQGMLGAFSDIFTRIYDWILDWVNRVVTGLVVGFKEGLATAMANSLDTMLGPFKMFADAVKGLLKKAFDWNSPMGFTIDMVTDFGKGIEVGAPAAGASASSAMLDAFGPDMFTAWAPPAVAPSGAPPWAGAGAGGGGGVQMTSQTNLTVQVQAGPGAAGVAAAAREGTLQAEAEARRELLADLEPYATV